MNIYLEELDKEETRRWTSRTLRWTRRTLRWTRRALRCAMREKLDKEEVGEMDNGHGETRRHLGDKETRR